MATKVITWQDDRGNTVDLTIEQAEKLESAGKWIRNPATGCEYCSVSYGLHHGEPTYTDEEIADICR